MSGAVEDDKAYATETPYAIGESWGRMYQGLKARGVPDQQAADIVIAWIRAVNGVQSPPKEVLDDERDS